jgi:hypothetical protein
MDGKSCARVLVIAGFTRIHAATDSMFRVILIASLGVAGLSPMPTCRRSSCGTDFRWIVQR